MTELDRSRIIAGVTKSPRAVLVWIGPDGGFGKPGVGSSILLSSDGARSIAKLIEQQADKLDALGGASESVAAVTSGVEPVGTERAS